MGMVHSYKKGDMKDAPASVKKAASSMSDKDAKDFASTKHTGKPDKVEEQFKNMLRKMYENMLKETENNKYRVTFEVQLHDAPVPFSTIIPALDKDDAIRQVNSMHPDKKMRVLNVFSHNPDRKDLMGAKQEIDRHGVPKNATKAQLKKIRSNPKSSKGAKDLAHWKLNMHHNEIKESTKSWEKSLRQIAKDRQLKMLSKKDKATLNKIADLMAKANESTNEAVSFRDRLDAHSGAMRGLDKYIQMLKKVPSPKKVKYASKLAKELQKLFVKKESVNERQMSSRELERYFLYMRKYKPKIWNHMKKNRELRGMIKKLKLESINESTAEKKKIELHLIKKGNSKKDAADMVNKNYKYVAKTYRNASVSKKAEIISSLQGK